MKVSGTIRQVVIDGTTYDADGEVDASYVIGKYTNESKTTTGGNVQKKVLRAQNIEKIDVIASEEEAYAIKEVSERPKSYTMSIVTASGATLTCTGFINVESWSSAELKMSITMTPDNEWELFSP